MNGAFCAFWHGQMTMRTVGSNDLNLNTPLAEHSRQLADAAGEIIH